MEASTKILLISIALALLCRVLFGPGRGAAGGDGDIGWGDGGDGGGD